MDAKKSVVRFAWHSWRRACTRAWLSELKEATLRRDFATAAEMLSRVATLATDCKEEYFWYGMELFKQVEGCDELSTTFFEQMSASFPTLKWEWLMEFILHMMTSDDFSPALTFIINTLTIKEGKPPKSFFLWDIPLTALSALLSFAVWKNCCETESANKSSDILEQANNALKRLKNVIKLDGTWDAQLIAIFDLLIQFGKSKQAFKMVRKYYETHPGNPNAVRYMKNVKQLHPKRCKSGINSDQIIEVDGKAFIVPPDAFLNTEGSASLQSVLHVMALLDYGPYSNSIELWNSLWKSVYSLLKYEINDLLSCSAWTERREWWSRFYFNLEQAYHVLKSHKCATSLEMVCCRALTAHFLIRQGNDYTTYVMLGLVHRPSTSSSTEAERELHRSCVSPYTDTIHRLDSFLNPQEFVENIQKTQIEDENSTESNSTEELFSDDDSDIVTSDPALVYKPVYENRIPRPKAPPRLPVFTALMEEGKPWRRIRKRVKKVDVTVTDSYESDSEELLAKQARKGNASVTDSYESDSSEECKQSCRS